MAYNNPNRQNQFYGLPETNRQFKPSNLNPKVQIYQKHAKTPHQTTPTGTPHRNSILNCNQQSTPPTPDRKTSENLQHTIDSAYTTSIFN